MEETLSGNPDDFHRGRRDDSELPQDTEGTVAGMVEKMERKGTTAFFLEEMLEHVLKFVQSHKDRNNASLVCKAWYRVEANSRRHVFIGNCYAISPERLTQRFRNITSVTLKGKPRFSDFDLLPRNWGAYAFPWVDAFCKAYPSLEELQLKRMTVCDKSLEAITQHLTKFKSLALTTCDGFSTSGLASISRHCKLLQYLDLTENNLDDLSGSWLHFPQMFTSLVSLNFEHLQSEVDFEALESLVTRCTRLKTLKLNRSVTLMQLQELLCRATQLIELGTGSFSQELMAEDVQRLQISFGNCKHLTSLSGFWEVAPGHLPIIYQVCKNLTALNLSYTLVNGAELAKLASHCQNLQRLWVLDSVEDDGLRAFASTCKDLRDLRVYPGEGQGQGVSEEGLVLISEGCPNLVSILYFCGKMTNAALETMSRNCPKLESFRLCILELLQQDYTTGDAMDEGFGAIVRNCLYLRRLALSGLLTDKAFAYVGTYGKRLERLSVAFAGESDSGLQYVLQGCLNLHKLEIRDCPFGDRGLLSGFHRYESMRSLWMSNCKVTMQGCTLLARQKPQLVVEVIQKSDDEDFIESLYVYRSTVKPRTDMPACVKIL